MSRIRRMWKMEMIAALTLLAALADAALAADFWSRQRVPSPLEIERGFAEEAAAREAKPCAECHRADGSGQIRGRDAYPRLAGQFAHYLSKQLKDFAVGARPNPVMTPVASRLDEDGREELAEHFRALNPPARSLSGEERDIERGRNMAERGHPEQGYPPCASCHGEGGSGRPPVYPILAGQIRPYLLRQLRAFADGARANDPDGVMRAMARRMPREHMESAAGYFASLPPRNAE